MSESDSTGVSECQGCIWYREGTCQNYDGRWFKFAIPGNFGCPDFSTEEAGI